VAEELAKEPTLEAVTIDRARKTISVATLGRTDVLKITERIKVTLEKAQAEAGTHGCNLLTSVGDCASCSHPLSQADSQTITIQHSQDLTTIARITCPTAPKFWRWRDIPWPKVVQRDVEFLEHADEIDEWKGQMVAAVLCGCFGLLAFSSHDHIRWSIARLPTGLFGGQLVHSPRGLGTTPKGGDRRPLPDVGGGGGQRKHRGLG
jgi:Cd2+/Zn2+-exporting ATPase